MDEIDQASERLRNSVAQYRRRALVKLSIQWTMGVALMFWMFPDIAIFWAILVGVPFSLLTFGIILFRTKELEKRFASLADRMRENQR
jgi:hypothetical protein